MLARLCKLAIVRCVIVCVSCSNSLANSGHFWQCLSMKERRMSKLPSRMPWCRLGASEGVCSAVCESCGASSCEKMVGRAIPSAFGQFSTADATLTWPFFAGSVGDFERRFC